MTQPAGTLPGIASSVWAATPMTGRTGMADTSPAGNGDPVARVERPAGEVNARRRERSRRPGRGGAAEPDRPLLQPVEQGADVGPGGVVRQPALGVELRVGGGDEHL